MAVCSGEATARARCPRTIRTPSPGWARWTCATGEVTGWIDASPLVGEVGSSDPEEVLNGIAVDGESGRLWLTGKRWPTVFEVRIVPGTLLPEPGLG